MHFENEIEHKILVTYVIAKVSAFKMIEKKILHLHRAADGQADFF